MLRGIFICIMFISSLVYAKDINISVITHEVDGDSFWKVLKQGINDAKKETGVNISYYYDSKGDLEELAKMIDTEVEKKVDALVITIPNRDVLGKSIKKIKNAGIPFITINAGGDFGKKMGSVMHVGQSEYEAGYLAGKKAKKAGVKSFLCLPLDLNHVGHQRRCQGFADALVVENVMLQVDPNNPAETQKIVTDNISKYDAVLVLGGGVEVPVMKAYDDAGLVGKKKIFTFDVSPNIIQGIKSGKIEFTIDQQQYLQGYMPIIVLSKMLNYGLVPSGDINSGPGFITKDNYKIVEKYAGTYR